jgi:signal transduction histidine kinase
MPVETHPAVALLWHNLLLGQRLYLYAWIRFLVVTTIIAGSFFAVHVVGIENLDVRQLLACAAILAVFNCAIFFIVRQYRRPEETQNAYQRLVFISYLSITFDFLVLTYLIWIVGGGASPFLAFYLLHVILAGVLLSHLAAYIFASLGYLLLAFLVLGEFSHWLPQNRPAGAVLTPQPPDFRYVLTVLVVYGLLMALAAFLTTSLAEMLRRGERRLREANEELVRLSNLRRDFLHIALHNLRSPVSTIGLLLNNLESGLGGPLTKKQAHWTGRAQHRLRDLLDFTRALQVLAELETGDLQKLVKKVDLTPLLRNLVSECQDLASQQQVSLRDEFLLETTPVLGVENLLRDAVVNYLTNAIKYTPKGGTVVARVLKKDGWIRIEVSDTGRGISPENQTRLFNEYVRIPPEDESMAAMTGTGLGLFIVRRIAEVHGGRVGVSSELHKGSTFFFDIPAA